MITIKIITTDTNSLFLNQDLLIKRHKDTVKVRIMYDRNSDKYCFVNLTKGHICSCRFNSITDALADLEQYKKEGKIIDWLIYLDKRR